jgi:hypothetical protein
MLWGSQGRAIAAILLQSVSGSDAAEGMSQHGEA